MIAHEIRSDRWSDFLNRFTRAYRGLRLAIDVVGGPVGAVAELLDVPLAAIGLGNDINGVPQLVINTGQPAAVERTFVIRRPTRLWAQEGGRSAAAELQVRAADGSLTLVRVEREPVRSDYAPRSRRALELAL